MNLSPEQESALAKLMEFSDYSIAEFEKQENATWDSLTYDQQLDVFCYVIRNVVKGELLTRSSYRYILYEIFKFQPDSYWRGMDCGFMKLHNMIPITNTEKITEQTNPEKL